MGKRYLAIGGDFTTTSANQEIFSNEIFKECPSTKDVVYTNVSFKNVGTSEIHFIVNGGDVMPLDAGQMFACGSYDVHSLIIVESGSTIRLSGFGCVGRK